MPPILDRRRARTIMMKVFTRMAVPLFAMAFLLPLASQAQTDKPLTAYRDKNRVLLVFAPTPQDAAYQEQIKLWLPEKTGFDDRQLLVVPVFANARKMTADQQAPLLPLMKKHAIDGNTFAVVLIGKDGHDAYHASKPVPADALYGVIDAMPMRRAEMKRPTQVSPTPHRPDVDHDE